MKVKYPVIVIESIFSQNIGGGGGAIVNSNASLS